MARLLGIASALKAAFLPVHDPDDALLLVQETAKSLGNQADRTVEEFRQRHKGDPIVQLFEEVVRR